MESKVRRVNTGKTREALKVVEDQTYEIIANSNFNFTGFVESSASFSVIRSIFKNDNDHCWEFRNRDRS